MYIKEDKINETVMDISKTWIPEGIEDSSGNSHITFNFLFHLISKVVDIPIEWLVWNL